MGQTLADWICCPVSADARLTWHPHSRVERRKGVPASQVLKQTGLPFALTFGPQLILKAAAETDPLQNSIAVAGCTVAAAGWRLVVEPAQGMGLKSSEQAQCSASEREVSGAASKGSLPPGSRLRSSDCSSRRERVVGYTQTGQNKRCLNLAACAAHRGSGCRIKGRTLLSQDPRAVASLFPLGYYYCCLRGNGRSGAERESRKGFSSVVIRGRRGILTGNQYRLVAVRLQ